MAETLSHLGISHKIPLPRAIDPQKFAEARETEVCWGVVSLLFLQQQQRL